MRHLMLYSTVVEVHVQIAGISECVPTRRTTTPTTTTFKLRDRDARGENILQRTTGIIKKSFEKV